MGDAAQIAEALERGGCIAAFLAEVVPLWVSNAELSPPCEAAATGLYYICTDLADDLRRAAALNATLRPQGLAAP